MFVYDYHPLSETLDSKYFQQSSQLQAGTGLPENVLWSYITQIASALKCIHSAGLACRIIEPSKILITDKNRLFNILFMFIDVFYFQDKNKWMWNV